MFTVCGAGFGLYGYVPALLERFAQPLVLPEAYRRELVRRPALAHLEARIQWVPTSEAALAIASGLVVATPPAAQMAIVRRALAQPQLRRLVLEKPLAVTPEAATDLLRTVVAHAGLHLRVGYTFLHTKWFAHLAWPAAVADTEIVIVWEFMAHHFACGRDTWKRRHVDGGGVLRFYGVHLLALLTRQGYERVARSEMIGVPGQPERWEAEFRGPRLPPCRVVLNSRSQARRFSVVTISGGARTVRLSLASPFDGNPSAGEAEDQRVPALVRLLCSFDEDDAAWVGFYDRVNRLWQHVEHITTLHENIDTSPSIARSLPDSR